MANPSPTGAVLSRSTAELIIFDDESSNELPGSVDTTFEVGSGLNGFAYALAFQPDGKILVGGDFTTANSVPRNRIARINLDGKTDAKFSSAGISAGANDSVRSVVSQTDGRVLIGGLFTTVNATLRNRIARLNYDGTLDTTFNPGSGSDGYIYALAETFIGTNTASAKRKLIAVGNFTTFNSTSRSGIVRLNENGTVDSAFDPGTGVNGTNGTVYCVAVQTDGKVVIGGDFSSFGNVAYRHLVRLNQDGSLDTTFNAGSGPDRSVRAITLQLDGKIVIGGLFENVNGVTLNHIARLESSGAVDSTFAPGLGANDSVGAISLQADGKILLGGEFTRASGLNRNRITRLNPDGSVDPSINLGAGANSFVAALGVQAGGKIILGGGFTEFDGVSRPRLARIYGRSITGSGKIEFSSAQFEVNENGTNAVISVRRFGGTAGEISVHVTTSDGSAQAGTDFSPVSIDLTFAEGESIQSFAVPIIDNDFIEADKAVNMTLSSTTGEFLGNQTAATLLIRNDDGGISFSSPTYRFAENSPSGTALINIIRTGSSIGTASVDFLTTTNGTATPANDFTVVTNTIFFREGETNKVVSIPLVNDAIIEGDETVTLLLTNATGGILSAPTAAILVIVDDDSGQGNLMFSQVNYTVAESAGFATVSVIRTNGSQGFITVDFSAGGGTALPGSDYAPTNGTLVFGDGEVSKSFSVKIFDDALPEGDEFVNITLSNPTGGALVLGTNEVVLTIADNDVAFSFSTPAYVINEGDGDVTLTVRRENGSQGVAVVSYQTTSGSALAGLDYIETSNTLVFADGETFKTFSVSVLQDSLVEGDEFFFVNLVNPSAGTQLGSPTNALVTITDDDSSMSLSAAEYTVDEGGTNVTIRVVRTNSSSGTVSVNFATSNATAIASSDFIGTNVTLVFLPGETAKAIVIPIIDDVLVEGNESFTVRLTNPATGVALGNPAIATVTIIDNDAGLRFSSPTYRLSESGVSATITVLRTTVTNTTVSVNYRTTDGTAREGLDYLNASGVLIFTNGETARTFVVPVIDDTLIEGDETVLISLFAPSGQSTIISPGAAVLTIVDNDGSVILPAGSALESESIPNGVIDPGENVSLYFSFRNAVGADTINLVATLLPGSGITSPSAPQNYGVLRVNGDSRARLFSFTASGTNGQRITATFQLRDGSQDFGTGSFTYTLGRTATRFSNSTPITIIDGSSPPTVASPYASIINVSGIVGAVSKVSVTLSKLNHSFADDIDVLLVSPTGEKIILMSDAGGGNSIDNATITFDDEAGVALPDSGLISTGTFRPSNYSSQPSDFFPPPAPVGPYSSGLAALNGVNPNGAWFLYVVDDAFFNSGNISGGWSLSVDASSGLAPIADLSVTMTDSPDPAATNNNLTYTVTVRNNGPSTASGIVVTDVLPAGTTFVSDTCGCFTQNGNTLAGNLGSLPRDGARSFNIVVNPTAVGSITNSISVFASEVDPNPLNNAATAETIVDLPRADMAIAVSGSPNPVQINATLTFSLVVSNLGPVSATGVVVSNQLPAGVAFLSANTSQGSQTLA
ncbi:MAG: Calx-beta domain-containing protein, partial [Verrucomicrobiota bacterium]